MSHKHTEKIKELKEEFQLIFDRVEMDVEDTDKHPDCSYRISEKDLYELRDEIWSFFESKLTLSRQQGREEMVEELKSKREIIPIRLYNNRVTMFGKEMVDKFYVANSKK